MNGMSDLNASAKLGSSVVKKKMAELRVFLDSLEDIVGQEYWPIPTYEEILLTRHKTKNSQE